MPVNTGAPLTGLDALLDDTATELDDLLDEVAAMELDDLLEDTAATELDDLLDGATELATELEVPPHTSEVKVAPFLPTPATVASLSFTHSGDTTE